MLERFTKAARAIVVDAEAEARALGAPAVGAEHLLVATLRRCPGPWWGLPSPERVRSRLVSPDPDVDALATIGISLPDVRRAVEEAFGPGVWDAPRGRRRLPFTKEAKHVLELALREALELRIRRLDHHLILLGLTREEGTARRLLTELGVHVEAVRDRIRLEYAQLAR
jgi:ATP-dependent Clp protease ATP-binding subunit ClpA